MLEKYFYSILTSLSAALLCIHGWTLSSGFSPVLFLSYGANVLLAAAGYFTIYKLRLKHPDKLGFIFMGLSGIKFLVFFLLLQPMYNADGTMSTIEFGMFFIPYSVTTATETIVLVRTLNKE
jgi:hypothetical protein